MSNKVKSVDVPLDEPVEHDGVKYEKLTLRRMKAGDTLVAEGEESEARAGFKLYAALAGVPFEVIADLDLDDFMTLVEKAAPLMGKSGAGMLEDLKKALAKA
ncbi:phage tail assembly protein [Roseibium salinum]|uniref:Phage tail assembly protein n=2 Tax=Roseibium salinum TaxID=1604349 RepID=A0ABT3R0K1_9HYPH|nr:phage tail assembly protein [Roseibium sp. DSM 29163]MCX2722621.1 phage tail assembly protein [Roseibium sp. DSM 29163]